MIRNLKTLGLATVAVLSMSALVASTAQAQFTASSYPTTVTATSGLGNEEITTEAGSVECAGHFVGTLAEASNTLTITPAYSGCSAFGFSATVKMNGCAYLLHRYSAIMTTVTIECPAEKSIQIVAGPCEATIGAQGPLFYFYMTNGGWSVYSLAIVSGIAYTATKDGFLCPFNGTGAKTGATYTQVNAIAFEPTTEGGSFQVD